MSGIQLGITQPTLPRLAQRPWEAKPELALVNKDLDELLRYLSVQQKFLSDLYGLVARSINDRHMVGIAADRPTAAEEGRTYLSTDTGVYEVDVGTTWVVAGPMAFHWFSNVNLGITASDTRFFLLTGAAPNATDSQAIGTRFICPKAGTAKNLYVEITTAPAGAATRTFTFYKNGVATALSAVISGAAVTANDTTNVVAVSAGDELSVAVINNATVPADSDGGIVGIVI